MTVIERDEIIFHERMQQLTLFSRSGFEKAKLLLLVGSGCLVIVFIFGMILCSLDISAGNSKRRSLASLDERLCPSSRATSGWFPCRRNLNGALPQPHIHIRLCHSYSVFVCRALRRNKLV